MNIYSYSLEEALYIFVLHLAYIELSKINSNKIVIT